MARPGNILVIAEPAQVNPAARNTSTVQYCPGTRATYLNYRQVFIL
jgi:hypothetical protein